MRGTPSAVTQVIEIETMPSFAPRSSQNSEISYRKMTGTQTSDVKGKSPVVIVCVGMAGESPQCSLYIRLH